MKDFLFSVRPIHVHDYMGVDFFDSSDPGCTFAATRIRAAEETNTGTAFFAKKAKSSSKGNATYTREQNQQSNHQDGCKRFMSRLSKKTIYLWKG